MHADADSCQSLDGHEHIGRIATQSAQLGDDKLVPLIQSIQYLSNGIPRERIYEIWSNSTQIKRGNGNLVPRNTVISQYSDALARQSRALEAVCEKLRQDYRGQFRAKATRIPTSIPRGASNVSVPHSLSALSGLQDDSRLIIAGDHLQMPPIASIEAPADAAYLVGSIQTYLTRRTFSAPVLPCVLERNYRSAEDIVAFARRIGYLFQLLVERDAHFAASWAACAKFSADAPHAMQMRFAAQLELERDEVVELDAAAPLHKLNWRAPYPLETLAAL